MPRPGKANIRGNSMSIAGMMHSQHDHNLTVHNLPEASPLDSQDAFNHKLFMNGILL